MTLPDTNIILRTYLLTKAAITALVGQRIYCPRAPENATLPNITFFTRGGISLPIKDGIASPSVQFQCWDDNAIGAREVYRALFDSLQGTGGYYDSYTPVVVGANTYNILSAREETQGQDLQDEIPGYYDVLTFFEIKIKL